MRLIPRIGVSSGTAKYLSPRGSILRDVIGQATPGGKFFTTSSRLDPQEKPSTPPRNSSATVRWVGSAGDATAGSKDKKTAKIATRARSVMSHLILCQLTVELSGARVDDRD